MRRGENDYTKSQISIRGSIHGARSVTSCEKENFMVCFQAAVSGKKLQENAFFFRLPLSLCRFLSKNWAVSARRAHSVYLQRFCSGMCNQTCAHEVALQTADHMHALTYICWVCWMHVCKFFKRFRHQELEWASLLAEFLSLGPLA